MGLRKKKTLIDQASDYVDTVRPQLESAVDAAREAAKDAPRSKAGAVPRRRPRQGRARYSPTRG